MSEYQKVRLAVSHGPDTHFDGKLIHSFSTQNREGSKSRWTELRLWETRGGAWVTESVGCSTHGNEREIREVAVIEDQPGYPLLVMAAWGWTSASKAFARECGWDCIRRVD
jgi:hypothetical protein